MRKILDAKYEKAHQNKVITKKCQHLSTKEHEIILTLLQSSKYLFDSTLGMWNTTPVDLELKDDSKLVCSRTYPVSREHEAMSKKESRRLVIL